jgi:rhodanese-related sulfurtransferase
MNRKPEQIRPIREAGGHIVWQAVGILAAAVVIGMVYNQTSPLGVRKPTPPGEPPALTQVTSSTAASTGNAVAPTNPPGWNFQPPNPATAATELRFPELKWPAVKKLLAANQIVLIDARLAETYALSRIPGAISLPAYSPVTELQAFAERFSRETRFVIYCNSESCDMSHELAAKLARQFGFTNLALMPGGFAEYVIAESGAANPPSQ